MLLSSGQVQGVPEKRQANAATGPKLMLLWQPSTDVAAKSSGRSSQTCKILLRSFQVSGRMTAQRQKSSSLTDECLALGSMRAFEASV